MARRTSLTLSAISRDKITEIADNNNISKSKLVETLVNDFTDSKSKLKINLK